MYRSLWVLSILLAACGSSGTSASDQSVPFAGLTPGTGLFTTTNVESLDMPPLTGTVASIELSNQNYICGDTDSRLYGADVPRIFISFSSRRADNPNVLFIRPGIFSWPHTNPPDADGTSDAAGLFLLFDNALQVSNAGTLAVSHLDASQVVIEYDATFDDGQTFAGKVTVPYCAAESQLSPNATLSKVAVSSQSIVKILLGR